MSDETSCMDNAWLLRNGTIGVLLSAAFGMLYGLLTMSRADPDECTILPFPLVVSKES